MNLADKTCIPNPAAGVPPLTVHQALEMLGDIPGWELRDAGHRIERDLKFHDYLTPWRLANQVAELAHDQQHFPDLRFGWGYCNISFMTEDINGLHENDFIMAAKVNELVAREVGFAAELRV